MIFVVPAIPQGRAKKPHSSSVVPFLPNADEDQLDDE
jgi:hypothetical protein